jgi:NAD(P)-dependent dehydrogenase (short-subunit alcohol dehydrogenase family)
MEFSLELSGRSLLNSKEKHLIKMLMETNNTKNEFQDKVVLVTGAGRGIGRAIAETFAAQGAVVAANDLSPVNLDETLRRIQSSGGRSRDYVFDVAKKMPVQGLVQSVLEDWGRIDILVNNAGVEPHAPLLTLDEWDWQRTLDVNLSGPFYTMQAAGRVMREAGGGAIVNIASIAGLHGIEGPVSLRPARWGWSG